MSLTHINLAVTMQAAQALLRHIPKLRLLGPPRSTEPQLLLPRDDPYNNPIAFFSSW